MSLFVDVCEVSIGREEAVVSVSCAQAIKYAEMFYCLNKGWEERIVLLNNDKKTTIAKNSSDRSAFEEKAAGILFKLSENAIGYVISNLMYYHHFKKARTNHIHIECEGKNHKTYDLTLFFGDDQEPIIGGKNEIGTA